MPKAAAVTFCHLTTERSSSEPAMIKLECWQENAKLIIPSPIKQVRGRNDDSYNIGKSPSFSCIDSDVGL